ncbi:MAG: preprotein translocase subunit SecE [Saprospiraceae bacterium]|jgi:preprotein translocase subunit SecE|nr:preprotein translocase subunit SecE [Saprospiraceae bacterium]MBK6667862.1 preprotein translocase subunit SecE [Saprospiraceae bacterium]MBK7698106.1 preprotein translocase subunit SecE [Saprospiraceae bacterium]MBK8827526.1 preprotein translocase subunit SecE [Saprospiraceae bacterium]MBK8885262.1 preprotein translocase subunit SecE [Saprospiraceae bacterium]
MENIRLYLRESYDELINHVTWPTWPELFSSARLVIVSTIIISLIIFLFDFIANNLLKFIYEL